MNGTIARIVVFCLLFASPILATELEPQHEYEKPGYNPGHAYDGLIPEESIDLFTGGLSISHRDVRVQNVKGFDEFEKLITRRYNSKIYRQVIAGDGCHSDGSTLDDEFVGLGWSMHFGRLWDYDAPNPVLELPNGTRHMFYNDSQMSGRKISKSLWILQSKVDQLNIPYYEVSSSGPESVKMRFSIHPDGRYQDIRGGRKVVHAESWFVYRENYYSPGLTQFYYGRDLMGRLWPTEVSEWCSNSVHTLLNWDLNSSSPTLNSMSFAWLNGVRVNYSYQYIQQNGHRLLRRFSTPEGRTHQYDYDPATNELTRITISTDTVIDSSDQIVEYTYGTHAFKINSFFLSSACTRVVTQKRIKNSAGDFEVWMYEYPSFSATEHKVIVTDPKGNRREVTFQGYSHNQPIVWNVGTILREETFEGNGGTYESLLVQSNSYDYKELSTALDLEASSYDTVKIPISLEQTKLFPQTGQLSSTTFGTANDFDRYGNPNFRNDIGFGGELIRRTEYKYEHRDGDSDDFLMGQNNFVHSLANVRLVTPANQTISETQYDHYNDPSEIDSFGLTSQELSWDNETGSWIRKSLYYTIRELWKISEQTESRADRNTSFNPSCNMVTTVTQDLEQEAGRLFHSEVDQNPWLYTATINPNGQVTSYDYDRDQRLISIRPPNGDATSIFYNDAARKVILTEGTASTIESFDSRGRLVQREVKISPDQSSYQTFAYDALNNLTRQSEKNGGTPAAFTTKTYDALNRVTSVLTIDGLTEYLHNGPDVTVRIHDENGNNNDTLLRYDALGRLTSVTEPNGIRTNYSYDALDRLTLVVQGSNTGNPLTRSFTYNSRGKLTSETHPESGTTTYKYDMMGRLIEKKFQGMALPIRYTYDLRDRLLTIDYPTDTDVAFYYDGNFSSRSLPGFSSQTYVNPKSQLTGMVDATGTTIWPDYSARQELLSREIHLSGISNTLTLRYTYDSRGNLDSIQYPSGQIIKFPRNDANGIQQIIRRFGNGPESSLLNSIDYNSALLPSALDFANGLSFNITSDMRNRPDILNAGSKLLLDYRYNARGLIDQILTSQDNSPAESRDFRYDEMGRLTRFDSNTGTLNYQFDIFGNFTGKTGSLTSGTYSYTNNRIDSVPYSASGNQLSANGRALSYNEENRVKQVTGTGIKVSYIYDGKGNRTKSFDSITGKAKFFVYDEGGSLLSEMTQNPGGLYYFDKEFIGGPTGTLVTANYAETPRGVSVEDLQGGTRVQWQPVDNCRAGINVYRSQTSGGPYQKVNASPVTGTFFDDSTAIYCAPYYYVVRTEFSDATLGPSSAEILHVSAGLMIDENFNDGVADSFTVSTGNWSVNSAVYGGTAPTNSWGITLSPTVCNNCVIRVDAKSANLKTGKNAFVTFDYTNTSNFKFAGFDATAKKWIIGDVISGTRTDRASLTENLQAGKTFTLEIRLDAVTRLVTLKANNVAKTAYTFSTLGSTRIGFAILKAQSTFDNLQISSGANPPGTCGTSVQGPYTDYSAPPLYFHLNDHLGTTRIVTNENGDVTGSFEYYPFGEAKQSNGCFSNDQQFTGKRLDSESGLQYFGARYLSNDLTRFTSVDPADSWSLEDPQSWNRYSYSLNDPVNLIDPNGEAAADVYEWFASGASQLSAASSGSGSVALDFLGNTAADLGVAIVSPLNIGSASGDAISQYGGVGDADANLRIAAAVAGDTGTAILTGVCLYGSATRLLPKSGPYANIPDSPSVGSGKRFTQSQKGKFLDANEARNGGVLRSDKSGQQLVRAQKHTKGVTPPKNEAHVDHIKARSKGGSNSSKNAQVLSREENLKKGVN